MWHYLKILALVVPKVCSKCFEKKPTESFIKDNRRTDGYSGVCRACGNTQKRINRKARPEKYHKGDNERAKRNRAKSLKLIIEHTGLTCEHCNYVHTTTAPFDWHHKNPEEKEYSIGNLVRRATTILLEKEIKKCIFLCKNCHALEHERLRKERKK